MSNYSGQFSVANGPTYSFISVGKKVTVSAFAHGSLQGSATLDSTTKTAALYSSSGPGDFTASATLDISKKVYTLKYNVVYSGQQGSTTYSGVIGSWSDN